MSFMMSLMIMAFLMEILTLAPQYSTFGTQQALGKPCMLDMMDKYNSSDPKLERFCRMSNISQFYNRISVSLPFFSTVFYLANWMLIIVLAFSLLFGLYTKESEDLEILDDDFDEDRIMLKSDV